MPGRMISMPGRRASTALLALGGAAWIAWTGGLRAQTTERSDLRPFSSVAQMETGLLRDWPEPSRTLARAMISEYGRPDDYTGRSLIWVNNGPWKRTVVHRDALKSGFFRRRRDEFLEQVVAYKVPLEKVKAVQRFSSKIRIDLPTGEMSVRSDSQSLNFLTLNLADEVITGKREPDDAWEFLDRLTRLAKAGKSSQYLSGLSFGPQADPPLP